jgi:hypothetical protein
MSVKTRARERKPKAAVRSRVGKWLAVVAVIALVAVVVLHRSLVDGRRLAAEAPRAVPASIEQAVPAARPGPGSSPAAHLNGQRAMQFVREVVAFGPRPVGSKAHQKLESYLRGKLRADNLEEDRFTASTPNGPMPMRNFIAKFPGTRAGIIVVAGHYDTKPLAKFVGANDGGSSTGLLLELANELRGKKLEGYSVWLVWLDGEEAFKEWSATDSVYGSRHLAEKWQKDGTSKKVKAFLLVDMIGDADLNVEHELNSAPWLEDLILQAATRLGYQSHFFRRSLQVEDDHLPFAKTGVPVADLIDFDYGYDNVFWHTPADTLDKLSPNSLEIVGSVVLETIRLIDASAH